MEFGRIEKQVHIDAAPEVVYDVVSRPEHISKWWAIGADFEPIEGGNGTIVFRNQTVQLTVVEALPPTRFRFFWNYPAGTEPSRTNGTLVTFELAAHAGGTMLTLVEEGMREQGWEAAQLESYYNDHVTGWTSCLDRLIPAYVAQLNAR